MCSQEDDGFSKTDAFGAMNGGFSEDPFKQSFSGGAGAGAGAGASDPFAPAHNAVNTQPVHVSINILVSGSKDRRFFVICPAESLARSQYTRM